MSSGGAFKLRHFTSATILWGVRWYSKYGVSHRELQEIMAQRGVAVDHKTLHRLRHPEYLRVINTDKNPTCGAAIENLKRRGQLPEATEHR